MLALAAILAAILIALLDAILAACVAGGERRQDALRRIEARHQVADGCADLVGGAVARAGDIHDAGLALHDHIVARAVLLRAAVAEAGDGGIDHGRPPRGHRLVAEAQTIHRSRPKILDQDVGRVDQAPQHLLAAPALHVERDALLVAVDGQEIGRLVALEGRREGARVVALAGLLDLDHLGPQVAQLHGAVGPRQHPRQVDDAQSFERAHLNCPRRVRARREWHSGIGGLRKSLRLHGMAAARQGANGPLVSPRSVQ